MATNGEGVQAGREVYLGKGAALRKWHSHSHSKAVERRKSGFALRAASNHPQSWIDRGHPVGSGLDKGVGDPRRSGNLAAGFGWKGVFIRFRRCG